MEVYAASAAAQTQARVLNALAAAFAGSGVSGSSGGGSGGGSDGGPEGAPMKLAAEQEVKLPKTSQLARFYYIVSFIFLKVGVTYIGPLCTARLLSVFFVHKKKQAALMVRLVAARGKHAASWGVQFWHLAARALRNTRRNPFPFFLHGVTAVRATNTTPPPTNHNSEAALSTLPAALRPHCYPFALQPLLSFFAPAAAPFPFFRAPYFSAAAAAAAPAAAVSSSLPSLVTSDCLSPVSPP